MSWAVHTVVLDMDDTLFAERQFVLSGFQAVDAWLEENRHVGGFFGAASEIFDAGQRGTIFDEALRRLRVQDDPNLIRSLVAIYRDHAPAITLLPDARGLLEWTAPRFNLGLVTDGYLGVQKRKLQALAIERLFGCVVFTDALGRDCWKPSTAGFLQIMKVLPGFAGGYVYVADNPRKDFIGPRSLGWRTIRVRRPGAEHATYDPKPDEAADAEVVSLDELPKLLRSSDLAQPA